MTNLTYGIVAINIVMITLVPIESEQESYLQLEADFIRWFHTVLPGTNPVTRYLDQQFFSDIGNITSWLKELHTNPHKDKAYYSIYNEQGKRIGIIGLKGLSGNMGLGIVGIAIGEIEEQNRGYSGQAIEKLIRIARELNLKMLRADIKLDNQKSMTTFRKRGFIEDKVNQTEDMGVWILTLKTSTNH